MHFDSNSVANVFRWASNESDSADLDRFLQRRIALFARLLAGLFTGVFVVGAGIVAVAAPHSFVRFHLHPAKLVNLGLAVAFWIASYQLPRGELSRSRLIGIDLGQLLLVSVGIGVAVAEAPVGYHLEFAGLFVLALVLVLRSALIPSSPSRTLLVGLVASPAAIIGAYRQATTSPLGILPLPGVLLGLAMWCFATIMVAAVVSRVVYGLVSQVREATRLGQYTLRDKIGEGGMGAVYRADHALLRRPTAIKLLMPERVGATSIARFEREVQLTSQLSHPNTVAVYDYGRTSDGIFYYAMEYLEGRTLDALVREEGPQNEGRVVHILLQITGSLREAHDVGLIHRDIKPSNVLLCVRGGIPEFVKVIDFGLVKQVNTRGDATLTEINAIAGTPLYMAPECLTHPDEIDQSVDIYALGCLAYFLLTGTPPFTGDSVIEVCSQHLYTEPTPPSERKQGTISPTLEALVLRCLAKLPAGRPHDQELLTALEICQRKNPWPPLVPTAG